MNVNQTLLRLVKDVNDIKAALRNVVTNLPLYDIANENSPAALSTDQNNYVPGNYDILRINATADITITGFAGGVKGRFLEILNVGNGRITYVDGSTSSLPANRFNLPYDNNVTQLPNARVRFYYDSTQERWTLSDAPNIQGEFGRFSILASSTFPILQTVSFDTYTKLQPDVILTDEWGYWDSTNKKFVIPSGESGLYVISINFTFTAVTSGTNYMLSVYPIINATGSPPTGGYINYHSASGNNLNSYFGTVNLSYYTLLEGGDDVTVYIYHNLVAGVNIAVSSTTTPVLILNKAT